VPRIPLLAGSKVAIVNAGDDAVVLSPPPPREPVADVAAAVRDSLRFPLAGEPLEALVPRGGRATLLVEPPAQPVPQTPVDPRPAAIAAAIGELERVGVTSERTTILVAGGLARRTARRELDQLVPPELARRFRGTVVVHDAASPELVPVDGNGLRDVRVNVALLETDLVLALSAAETVLHGGPGLLVGAADAATIRGANAYSLLETAASHGWQLGVALERALGARVPLVGMSLVLTLPRLTGMLQGYPYEEDSVDRVVASPLRRLFAVLPGAARRQALRSVPASRGVSAAFAGPPSVAHAEALLRGTEERARALAKPLDAICLGIPDTTPYLPRERPNPLLAANVGLALALRLWRDAFPVAEGGTAILVHPFERRFGHPTQQPYRNFFRAIRAGTARDFELMRQAESDAAADAKAIKAYREGQTHHPLLPFADWSACAPALGRLGTVLVAGCRDHDAARALGLVPTHGVGAAIQMAQASAGAQLRIGFLLAPPFFPLRVHA
jgi:Lactate racemase N-terminal domain